MPLDFKLEQCLHGFAAAPAKAGEEVPVMYRELLGPWDAPIMKRLDALHGSVFCKIGDLAEPARVSELIVVIDKDLNGRAYVDELPIMAQVALANGIESVEKGQIIRNSDLSGVESVDIEFDVSEKDAVVIVRSFLWRRSLFYDFGPLHKDPVLRTYDLAKAMGQQMTLLLGLPLSGTDVQVGQSRLRSMKQALDHLDRLLDEECDSESDYQELLDAAPWMLGNSYRCLVRHGKLDDENIPDFTALRAYDECHDVVEIKQPFLRLFRSDGAFAAPFSNAWDQAERYLDFCQRQRSYLLDQKRLRFENPRCILLAGRNLTAEQSSSIRAKEAMNRLITVMSYDQLRENARHVFEMVAAIDDSSYPGIQ